MNSQFVARSRNDASRINRHDITYLVPPFIFIRKFIVPRLEQVVGRLRLQDFPIGIGYVSFGQGFVLGFALTVQVRVVNLRRSALARLFDEYGYRNALPYVEHIAVRAAVGRGLLLQCVAVQVEQVNVR